MRNIILGTAGHIDHGKSALVKALTGIDPDRLKEEKQRGITIDIGFADLLFDDLTVGIIDVPGHERLIKNMLAGAGSIDMALLVIAADESIMPQTKEHLAICSLLDIKTGITVINKIDLVDKEMLELVTEEIKDFLKGTFLENKDISPVSSLTGENIDLLKDKIKKAAKSITQKSSKGLFRLPIDRVFTLKGFGTVVTGTAMSGTINVNDNLEILPSRKKTKVRGLQSHNKHIETGCAGGRIAVNLQSIEKDDIKRGDTLVKENTFLTTNKLDVLITLLKNASEIKNRSILHFHIATSETTARIILYDRDKLLPGQSAFCQIRLKDPILAMNKDRFIIRKFSPLETLGGGIVVDPTPPIRRWKENFSRLDVYLNKELSHKLSQIIKQSSFKGLNITTIRCWINEDIPAIDEAIAKLLKDGEIITINNLFFHKDIIDQIHKQIIELLSKYHKKFPLKPGMAKEELKEKVQKLDGKIFMKLLSSYPKITIEKEFVRLNEFKSSLANIESSAKENILKEVKNKAFQPPP
ncbi:selenocysteine-specific translation elongation factor [Candidatus Magnetoovum chiemensis]|nr:selenocysteine-specific translation elongation factor [Candidatus Magnetoovum chiemensis]